MSSWLIGFSFIGSLSALSEKKSYYVLNMISWIWAILCISLNSYSYNLEANTELFIASMIFSFVMLLFDKKIINVLVPWLLILLFGETSGYIDVVSLSFIGGLLISNRFVFYMIPAIMVSLSSAYVNEEVVYFLYSYIAIFSLYESSKREIKEKVFGAMIACLSINKILIVESFDYLIPQYVYFTLLMSVVALISVAVIEKNLYQKIGFFLSLLVLSFSPVIENAFYVLMLLLASICIYEKKLLKKSSVFTAVLFLVMMKFFALDLTVSISYAAWLMLYLASSQVVKDGCHD